MFFECSTVYNNVINVMPLNCLQFILVLLYLSVPEIRTMFLKKFFLCQTLTCNAVCNMINANLICCIYIIKTFTHSTFSTLWLILPTFPNISMCISTQNKLERGAHMLRLHYLLAVLTGAHAERRGTPAK